MTCVEQYHSISERPVIIFATVFSQVKYKAALTGYKERLGLEGDGDLFTLCNISKTPFPTDGNFVKELADAFQRVAEEEILVRTSSLPRFSLIVCSLPLELLSTNSSHPGFPHVRRTRNDEPFPSGAASDVQRRKPSPTGTTIALDAALR
jgi:hypothetical protein